MIPAMSLGSGERAGSVHVWVSIVWMASVLNFSAGQTAQLMVKPRVQAHCGQHVTLTCDVNISDPGGIKLFQWIAKNKTCEHRVKDTDTKFVCQSEEKRLSLTILNVMPSDQGDYLCKLRSNAGATNAKTALVISSCYDPPVLQVNESQAFCCYTGVYPRGFIHWFRGDVNVTDSAVQLPDVKDKGGRYNVCSSLPNERGNLNQTFVCSLWSGSYRFHVSKRYIPSVQNVLGAAVCLRANLTVVLIMTAMAIKGIFHRLM